MNNTGYDVMEQIRKRRSVRSFDGRPLTEADEKALKDFSAMVENPYDIPVVWKFLSASASGLSSSVITGTDAYIAGRMPRIPHAEEAFGYSFEKIVIYARSLGVGTTWIAGTMDRPAFEKAMKVGEGEIMPCVSPLGYPAKKMSLREGIMRKGVRADSRMDFGELFFCGTFDQPMSPESAGKFRDALEAVRLAPSAVNKQPWRILIRDGSAHFYEKGGGLVRDGWDIQKIDMGIALCHFELGALSAGEKVSFRIDDPGLEVPGGLEYIASYGLSV